MSRTHISIVFVLLGLLFTGLSDKPNIVLNDKTEIRVIANPYENVDWSTFEQHKAALHVHTLQSDGYHMLEEVTNTYKQAGFTILAVTDHDWNKPNARIGWGHVAEEKASPYPKNPKPENYPANTTWPWIDYGGTKPEEAGMVGIQAGELTFRHHINSYFSDYGVWHEKTGSEAPYGGIVDEEGNEIWEDDILLDAKEKGGVVILNHPGLSDHRGFWERKPLEWYVERYDNHPADYLIGMEVTNTDHYADLQKREKYDEGLWDQLLARFMPYRPIWGFGTDDRHRLDNVPDAHTVSIVDKLTNEAVRYAMIHGQFFFCKSTRRIDLLEDDMSVFPAINRIEVDENAGTITITASDYDKIKWISAPESVEPVDDYKTSDQPWPLGRVVHEGETLNLKNTSDIENYVRAEVIRREGGEVYRTFTNPFGVGIQE